jgi:hypothetical protein
MGSESYKLATSLHPGRLRHAVTKLHNAIKELMPTEVTCAKQVSLFGAIFAFQQGEQFRDCLQNLFVTAELKEPHLRLGHRLIMSVHNWLLQQSNHPIADHLPEAAKDMIDDLQQHGPGAAKLRYIGGSVIGRLLFRIKQRVRSRLSDLQSIDVRIGLASVEILKTLCGKQEDLLHPETGSKYPQTLQEITDRQFGRLTFLTDSCYEFFSMLETYRLKKMSIESLAEVGGDLPGSLLQEMCCDTVISQKWFDLSLHIPTPCLFRKLKVDNVASTVGVTRSVNLRLMKPLLADITNRAWMLHNLKQQIIDLFMKTVAKTFRKHVIRTLQVQKSAAHRIKITQRQKKRAQKKIPKSKTSVNKAVQQPSTSTAVPVGVEVDSEEEEGACLLCSLPFGTQGSDWVACDGCRQWVCRTCSQLGSSAWKAVTEENTTWICASCSPFCYGCEVVLGATHVMCIGCYHWFCRACSKLTYREWKNEANLQVWKCSCCFQLALTD